MLANLSVLFGTVISSFRSSNPSSAEARFDDVEQDTAAARQNFPCRFACLSGQFRSSGFYLRAANLILCSWRSGTNKQYSSVWQTFCG
jgi:hypothetical protein